MGDRGGWKWKKMASYHYSFDATKACVEFLSELHFATQDQESDLGQKVTLRMHNEGGRKKGNR
jgi:hypothetical protein